MPTLTTEVLLNLPDDAVRSFVTSQFAAQLTSSPSVSGFFQTSEAVLPKDQTYVDNLAVAFVCSAIARSSLYGFAAAINAGAADHFWQTGLADTDASAIAEGQALYGWAFPAYCKDGDASFSDFLQSNPTQWAAELSTYVTTTPYIVTTITARDRCWTRRL